MADNKPEDLPDISRLHAEPRSNLSSMSDRQFGTWFRVSGLIAIIVGVIIGLIANQIIVGFICFIVLWILIAYAGMKAANVIIGQGTTEILDDQVNYYLMNTTIFGLYPLKTNELMNEDVTYGTARKE